MLINYEHLRFHFPEQTGLINDAENKSYTAYAFITSAANNSHSRLAAYLCVLTGQINYLDQYLSSFVSASPEQADLDVLNKDLNRAYRIALYCAIWNCEYAASDTALSNIDIYRTSALVFATHENYAALTNSAKRWTAYAPIIARKDVWNPILPLLYRAELCNVLGDAEPMDGETSAQWYHWAAELFAQQGNILRAIACARRFQEGRNSPEEKAQLYLNIRNHLEQLLPYLLHPEYQAMNLLRLTALAAANTLNFNCIFTQAVQQFAVHAPRLAKADAYNPILPIRYRMQLQPLLEHNMPEDMPTPPLLADDTVKANTWNTLSTKMFSTLNGHHPMQCFQYTIWNQPKAPPATPSYLKRTPGI